MLLSLSVFAVFDFLFALLRSIDAEINRKTTVCCCGEKRRKSLCGSYFSNVVLNILASRCRVRLTAVLGNGVHCVYASVMTRKTTACCCPFSVLQPAMLG